MKLTDLYGTSTLLERETDRPETIPIRRHDLIILQKLLDSFYKRIGIDVTLTTDHFLDRINDPRNEKPITLDELRDLFIKSYAKYRHQLKNFGPDTQAVLRDVQTHLNIPFVLVWDERNSELDLVAKTAMRKKNFMTQSPILAVERKDG